MIEIWKDVVEFPSYYQVSNFGNVRRKAPYSNQSKEWDSNNKLLSPRLHSNGYLRVMLSINGKHYDRYIHRIVAEAFCENPNNYTEVNHIDSNKTNNHYTNLEWCSRSYNNKHAYDNKLRSVCGCYGVKKKVAKIKDNHIISIYESVEMAAKENNIKSQGNISACCNYLIHPEKYKRPVRTVGGYKWCFVTLGMKVGDIID